jgi:hypothetical protein
MTASALFYWIYWIIVAVLVIMIVREALYLYFNHPRRYGKNGVWPASGRYTPTKEASGGMDPTGGMRPARPIPSEVSVGWWGGDIDQSTRSIGNDVYDYHAEIPSPVTSSVGWWGDSFFSSEDTLVPSVSWVTAP